MSRDWRISNALDQIDERKQVDPDFTLEKAKEYAILEGFRENELWKIELLWEVLNER